MNEAKPVTQERVFEIELMKAVAIIGMVYVHVFEMAPKPISDPL